MARLTEDARSLGFRAEKVFVRIDFVAESPFRHDTPGVELLIYHADKYEHVLQTYGVFLSHQDAVNMLADLDSALAKYDEHVSGIPREQK